jgi:serine/threonine protein kinase
LIRRSTAGRGPPTKGAELTQSLALAVAEAHRLGIVHRNLKRANVLLTTDGLHKIGDFGLAKSLGFDRALTRSGLGVGSPCYAAPEQAECRSKEVGAATDIYSLGGILYELLTGRPPFKAATWLNRPPLFGVRVSPVTLRRANLDQRKCRLCSLLNGIG